MHGQLDDCKKVHVCTDNWMIAKRHIDALTNGYTFALAALVLNTQVYCDVIPTPASLPSIDFDGQCTHASA